MSSPNCTLLAAAECVHDCACRWCHLLSANTDYGPMSQHAPYGFCTFRNDTCPTSYSMTCENLEASLEQYLYLALLSVGIVLVVIMFAGIMYKIVRDAQNHIDSIGCDEPGHTECLDQYREDPEVDDQYVLDDL